MIHYSWHGEKHKPRLYLLHGWGTSSTVWTALLPLLRYDFYCCSIDIPGFGDSPACQHDCTINDLTQTILNALQPAPGVWLGWSLGGLISLQLGLLAPEVCVRIINIASTPYFQTSKTWQFGISHHAWQPFVAAVAQDAVGAWQDFLSWHVRCPATSERLPQPTAASLAFGMQLLAQTDLRAALKDLNVPITYLLGTRDKLLPYAHRGHLQSLSDNVKNKPILGGHHTPFIAKPQAVLQELHLCEPHDALI